MANSIQYKWNVFCETEGNTVEKIQKSRPTTCPNNPQHIITSNLTTYEVQVAPQDLLKVSNSQGYYTSYGITFTAAANTTTTYNHIFPFDITILLAHYFIEDENKNDVLNIILDPDRIIGIVIANASIGNTVITVSNTVIENLVKGIYIKFGSDVTKYFIKKVDLMTSTIILSTPLEINVSSNTSINRSIYITKDFVLPSKTKLTVGSRALSTTYIPAGFIFRFIYENKTNAVKQFNLLLEHF